MPRKSVKKIESVDLRENMKKPRSYMPQQIKTQIQKYGTKQNKTKICTQYCRYCYEEHMRESSGECSKYYLSCSSWKFSFFKQETWFLVSEKSLSKITYKMFHCRTSKSNKPKFVLKSNIQHIHILKNKNDSINW